MRRKSVREDERGALNKLLLTGRQKLHAKETHRIIRNGSIDKREEGVMSRMPL